jgi:uncharacterized protein (TIGR02145 family)
MQLKVYILTVTLFSVMLSCKKDEQVQHDPTISIEYPVEGMTAYYGDSLKVQFTVYDADHDLSKFIITDNNIELINYPAADNINTIYIKSDLLNIGQHSLTITQFDKRGGFCSKTINFEIAPNFHLTKIDIVSSDRVDVYLKIAGSAEIISAGIIISSDTICSLIYNNYTVPIDIKHDTNEYIETLRFFNQQIYYFKLWVETSDKIVYSEPRMFIPYNHGELKDSRDNHTYKWVELKGIKWMAENLDYLPWVEPYTNCFDSLKHIFVYNYPGSNIDDAKNTDEYKKYGVRYSLSVINDVLPSGLVLPTVDQTFLLTDYLNSFDSLEVDSIFGGDFVYKSYKAENIFGLNFLPTMGEIEACDESYYNGGSNYFWVYDASYIRYSAFSTQMSNSAVGWIPEEGNYSFAIRAVIQE